jgi:hypothetical protein
MRTGLLSFATFGWWILKHSSDPHPLSNAKKLLMETKSHNRYSYWLLNDIFDYNDAIGISTSRTSGAQVPGMIVEDGDHLIITNRITDHFYYYQPLPIHLNSNSTTGLMWSTLGVIVFLQVVLLYRQVEWLSLLFANQNHL